MADRREFIKKSLIAGASMAIGADTSQTPISSEAVSNTVSTLSKPQPNIKQFLESFTGNQLSSIWQNHPEAVIENNTLSFFPKSGPDELVATETDFADVEFAADVRVVRGSVGLILRWQSPSDYYMVQFDIAEGWDEGKRNSVWFHAWTAEDGMHRATYPSAELPETGEWYRMKVRVVGHDFECWLGPVGGELKLCAKWTDPHKCFDSGAIGVWQCSGGEQGQYRNLEVKEILGTN